MHRARKSLGQNFLIDPNSQRRIAAAVDPAPDDEILEIGPGLGAITRILAGTVRRLIAVEIDADLADRLQNELGDTGIEVLHQDILELDLAAICADSHDLKIVGNIPYNITTPILFHLLDRRWRPAVIIIMVQREVADRILAAPATSSYSALSVGVRSVAHVERLFNVGRKAFRPVPNVDSTVLRITPQRPFPLSAVQEADLRELTRTAFAWRRKQLQRTLRSAVGYRLTAPELVRLRESTGFELSHRVETFEPFELVRLADHLREMGRPHAARTR